VDAFEKELEMKHAIRAVSSFLVVLGFVYLTSVCSRMEQVMGILMASAGIFGLREEFR